MKQENYLNPAISMQLSFEHNGVTFTSTGNQFHVISIEMDFDGPQPNHFGAPKAERTPLVLGEFVGRTRQGGSCNVDSIQLVPHCNGTHTESVGHIVSDEIWIGHAVVKPAMLAALISVTPRAAGESTQTYRPPLEPGDKIISAPMLQAALDQLRHQPEALVIRTLPNDPAKKSRAYTRQQAPAFLSVEAMQFINKLGVRHLLVDLPSVDRMYDDGLLTNHHIFWNVSEGSHSIEDNSWQDKTITEMVFVDDQLEDGLYGLSLQFPAFSSDAAPSRPVVWKVKPG